MHVQTKLSFLLVTSLACLGFSGSASAYTHKLTSAGKPVRWASTVPQIELRLDPEVELLLPPGQAYAAVAIAVEAWRYTGVPDVVVGEGVPPEYTPSARGNGIYVLHDWPFEDNRLAVTVTSYMPSGELLGADVLINGNVDYALLPEGQLPGYMEGCHDLAAVLTHEIGHVLGLDESEADESATMWPYIRAGETHQRSLDADDETGIVSLYRSEFRPPQMGCTQSTVARRTSRTPSGAWLLAAVGLGFWWRRRSGPARRRSGDAGDQVNPG